MQFVSVITDGGIITSVDVYPGDSLEHAIKDMELYFADHSFDPETDDARIFIVPEMETGIEIYSYNPDNPSESRELAIDRYSKLASMFNNVLVVDFTSVWDDCDTVTTKAKYNPATGIVYDIEISGANVEGICTREYITLPNGTELNVEYRNGSYVVEGASDGEKSR